MPNPFGVVAGSTPGSDEASYFVMFHAVPNPHPVFTNYNGSWSPEGGISRITASSNNFPNDPGCYGAKALYERIRKQLEQVYGRFQRHEFSDPEGVWPDESDFWNALNSGERSHASEWSAGAGSTLDSKIERIMLMVVANSEYDDSAVMVTYEFEGQIVSEPPDTYGLGSL